MIPLIDMLGCFSRPLCNLLQLCFLSDQEPNVCLRGRSVSKLSRSVAILSTIGDAKGQ